MATVQRCSLANDLSQLLIGQSDAVDAIVPMVQMHHAGLSPEGRPVGVVMLLGPTGSGKTHTVESLATVLHGSNKNLLRVDCGEFQMEHEVAKLIGAPPGYLGHRETVAMLNQSRINSLASESSDITIVLFDEVEKAAPSMTRMLLGILDKATLRLGDNSVVNFEKTLIFMTSNLGAKAMQRAINPDFGFEAMVPNSDKLSGGRAGKIGGHAIKGKFPPEFVNRIDAIVTFEPLDRPSVAIILDRIIGEFENRVRFRLGARGFVLGVTNAAKNKLIDLGFSEEFGARELKRTVQRELVLPIAAKIANNEIWAGCAVTLDVRKDQLAIRVSRN